MVPPLLRRCLLPFSPFLCFYLFIYLFRFRFNGKWGTVRSDLITVLRTVRSDGSLHESLLFSHRAVLETKRIAKMNGSRFFQSNCMVWVSKPCPLILFLYHQTLVFLMINFHLLSTSHDHQ